MESIHVIGGPLHGRTIQIADGVRYLHVPTITNRKPKQVRGFCQCIYELRTLSNGRKLLWLIDGYYNPPKYNL